MKIIKNRITISESLILLIILLTYPGILLMISGNANTYLHYLTPGYNFTYTYLHSVEKTPVLEKYILKTNGRINLVETQFESYGAGLPLEIDNFSNLDGKFILEGINLELDELNIRVARNKGQTIDLLNYKYYLKDLSAAGTRINIKAVSILEYLLRYHLEKKEFIT